MQCTETTTTINLHKNSQSKEHGVIFKFQSAIYKNFLSGKNLESFSISTFYQTGNKQLLTPK